MRRRTYLTDFGLSTRTSIPQTITYTRTITRYPDDGKPTKSRITEKDMKEFDQWTRKWLNQHGK